MTPKVKILKTSFRIHRRDTELRFVAKFGENRPLRSCRKQASIFIRPINEHTYNIDDTVVKHKGRLPEKPERSSGLGLSHKKTWAPWDSSQPPFWPKWGDYAQNSLNVVTP